MINKNLNGQESFEKNSEFWEFVNSKFNQLKSDILEKAKDFSFDDSHYPQIPISYRMTEADAVTLVTDMQTLDIVNNALAKTYKERLFYVVVNGAWLHPVNASNAASNTFLVRQVLRHGGYGTSSSIKAGELEGKYPKGTILRGFIKNGSFNTVSDVEPQKENINNLNRVKT